MVLPGTAPKCCKVQLLLAALTACCQLAAKLWLTAVSFSSIFLLLQRMRPRPGASDTAHFLLLLRMRPRPGASDTAHFLLLLRMRPRPGVSDTAHTPHTARAFTRPYYGHVNPSRASAGGPRRGAPGAPAAPRPCWPS
jgi:hypothetical protein